MAIDIKKNVEKNKKPKASLGHLLFLSLWQRNEKSDLVRILIVFLLITNNKESMNGMYKHNYYKLRPFEVFFSLCCSALMGGPAIAMFCFMLDISTYIIIHLYAVLAYRTKLYVLSFRDSRNQWCMQKALIMRYSFFCCTWYILLLYHLAFICAGRKSDMHLYHPSKHLPCSTYVRGVGERGLSWIKGERPDQRHPQQQRVYHKGLKSP